MDFEEFIRKTIKSAIDNGLDIVVFVSNREKSSFAYYGELGDITKTVAKLAADYPSAWDIIRDAVDLIESRNMKVTVINTEDQMNDYLIDLHLKSKDLNDSEEGL